MAEKVDEQDYLIKQSRYLEWRISLMPDSDKTEFVSRWIDNIAIEFRFFYEYNKSVEE